LLLQPSVMSTKAVVLALIGAATVGAAAAGGFVALRLNRADRALAMVGAPNAPVVTSPAPVGPPESPEPSASITSSPALSTPKASKVPPVKSDRPVTTALPVLPSTTSAAPVDPAPAVPPPAVVPPPPPDPPATATDVPPPPDPKPVFEEITVKPESVIGLMLDAAVSSDTAKVEDRITARVTRDVTVDGRVAIPSNARLEGVVTVVERGSKFKDQARIGIRFTTLYLPDNTKFSIQTEPIFRAGDPPTNDATAKVGAGAVLGAILGAVIGGKKGAAVGAAAGAGGGAAAQANSHSNDATFPAGAPMTVRLTAPVTVTVARDQDQ
jgi:hypothetical protein